MANFLTNLMSGLSGQKLPRVTPTKEMGVSGTAVFGGYIENREKNAKLVGSRRYVTATEIITNVAIVGAGLRYFLNLCAKPAWSCDPADDTPAAIEAAEFMESVLHDGATSWARIVRRSGMFRFHGFSINEWTAKKRTDGRIGIEDIESRPQHTIERWEVDERGTVAGVWQRSPQTGAELFLPRGKIVYLVDDMMTDSPEGMGWFRHLVEPAERMKEYLRLEGLGFERDLSGIPVGSAPIEEINESVVNGKLTQAQADQLIAGFKNFVQIEAKKSNTGLFKSSATYKDLTDDGPRTSSVPKWTMELLTGESTSSQHLGVAIQRLTVEMARIMGVENIITGSEGVGSQALSKDKSRNLYLSINATLKDMAECYDRDVIGPVWALNGLPDELRPTLKTEDVAFKEVEQITAALSDMAAAGAVLMPDDEVVNDIRDLLGVSRAPEMTPEMMGLLMPRPGAMPTGKPVSEDEPIEGDA